LKENFYAGFEGKVPNSRIVCLNFSILLLITDGDTFMLKNIGMSYYLGILEFDNEI